MNINFILFCNHLIDWYLKIKYFLKVGAWGQNLQVGLMPNGIPINNKAKAK